MYCKVGLVRKGDSNPSASVSTLLFESNMQTFITDGSLLKYSNRLNNFDSDDGSYMLNYNMLLFTCIN